MEINDIKSVAILKNIIVNDKRDGNDYLSKKGVMIIEDFNKKRIILDLENNIDITDVDFLEIKVKKKLTKIKYLFKSVDENCI
ncbi:MAG: hypothetical protein IJH20_06665 [Bacilli bacterium]|nr:hypothetical protein [Bacilli bacterium]